MIKYNGYRDDKLHNVGADGEVYVGLLPLCLVLGQAVRKGSWM